MKYVNDLKGKTFFIIAFKAEWQGFLEGRGYKTHLKKRGATLLKEFDKSVDYVVVGNGREKGRADTIKKAEKAGKEVLDEFKFFELCRLNLKGLKFAFTGGFHLGAGGLDSGPASVLKNVEAEESTIEEADFLVVGERRGKGKAADIKKADEIIKSGGKLQKMEEYAYMELIAANSDSSQGLDFPGLVVRLRNTVDHKKIDRAIKMLKKESYDLYADISDTKVSGIVKSQTSSGYYAPWIAADGKYSCYDDEMYQCMGLQGKVCKHILVLLLGLTRNEELDMEQAFEWTAKAKPKSPSDDEDESAAALLRYKGVKAGEVDWRPTETMPEDFYIL